VSRTQVRALIRRLHEAQQRVTSGVLDAASWETLDDTTPSGLTVNDVLRMWVWHFVSHHRELVLARGRLSGDNPHFHVPHYVREANEAFGRFIGELACLTDEQLDLRLPGDGRTIREIVQHTLGTLEGYLGDQIREAQPGEHE
jgi:hypothetical protein